MVIPPISAAQAGHSVGGGLLSSLTGGKLGGNPAAAAAGPKGDGSVGLFDGVLVKTLMGGAMGVGLGFIPFIPGGPILGGIVGAIGGAAIGVFGNWRKMQAIKQENAAALAAMGVQTQDPRVAQVLQSGQVQQLIPLVQQEQAAIQQGGVAQGTAQQTAIQQQQAAAQAAGQLPPTQTGTQQTIPVGGIGGGSSPAVVPGSGGVPGAAPTAATAQATAPAAAAATAVPLNEQGYNTEPFKITYTNGGGSAGDAGRPAAPVDPAAPTGSSDVSKIAPVQAGVGQLASTQAGTGAATIGTASTEDIGAIIQRLQHEIDQLKAMLEKIRADEEAVAATKAA